MEALRFSIKVFAAEPRTIASREFVPLFHRWIQESALDETMIDVADYSHVQHGPGIMLICHEALYAMDEGEGRLGLRYERKRGGPATTEEQLLDALRRALGACELLERDPSFSGRLTFPARELLVTIPDRLRAENSAATFERIAPPATAVLTRLFGAAPDLEHLADPKETFAVRVRAPTTDSVKTLLARA